MGTAFEAITTRVAWKAAAAVAKYHGVQISTAGKYEKATGTRPFVGIVEYGTDTADDMITVVEGIFPGLVSAEVAAGARVMPDVANPGKFVTAAATDDAVGIALEAITSGTIGSIQMVFSAATA